MSEFISLAETAKFIVDNRGKTVPTSDQGIPLIKTNCISNDNLYPQIDGMHFITQQTYDTWFRSHPEPDDIIITLKGSQNGAVCLVPDSVPFAIAQDMVAIRVDEKKINKYYLLAALRSREVQHAIKTLDVSGVIPHLKKSDFDKLHIRNIDRRNQEYIGELYYQLSKKITLLRQQNQTLEELALTLFNKLLSEDNLEDEISLEEIAKIGIGRTPPRKEDQWFSKSANDVKWISIKDMGICGVYINNTSEYLTNEAVSRFRIPIIPKNTVVLSFKMTLGRVAITTDAMLSNEAIAHFKIKDESQISTEYLFFYLKTYKYQNLGSTSSIVTSINSGMIKNIGIVIPKKEKMLQFSSSVKPLFNAMKSNSGQIETMTSLRDTLLPRLLSGELLIQSN